ncbi:helix-turn-helix domain-containing protein, partial [Vibrio parahaemolyticus]
REFHMKDLKLLQAFGFHLQEIRKANSLSQEQLALKAGLDRTYISGIERGRRNISLLNIYKLADSLEISVTELFDFEV